MRRRGGDQPLGLFVLEPTNASPRWARSLDRLVGAQPALGRMVRNSRRWGVNLARAGCRSGAWVEFGGAVVDRALVDVHEPSGAEVLNEPRDEPRTPAVL